MLSAAEIATGDRYEDAQFCERFGVDQSRIARAVWKRQSGIQDGLFCASHAEALEKRPDRGMAGQKRYTVGRYESQAQQGEATC